MWPAGGAAGRLRGMQTEPRAEDATHADTRWLTAEEQRAWRAYIRLAKMLMRQLVNWRRQLQLGREMRGGKDSRNVANVVVAEEV